jgi:aminoglycoside 6'-N-acetyltransferase I
MSLYTIRRASHADKEGWLRMRQCLWPDAPLEYLGRDLDRILADPRQAVFMAAHADGGLSAFIEVSLRDYAEGCESSPVGYIEAWYVDEIARGQRLGSQLMTAAENWAREHGCVEIASDTWLENETSINVHKRLGYREVDRLVHFVKRL